MKNEMKYVIQNEIGGVCMKFAIPISPLLNLFYYFHALAVSQTLFGMLCIIIVVGYTV